MSDTNKSPSPAKSGPASPAQKSPTLVKSPSPTPGPTGLIPAAHWAQEPVPEDDAESLAPSVRESTASVTSSILNYRMLHGRRYHSDVGNASYWGTNDEKNSESMDIVHHTLTLACGNTMYLAPLVKEKVQKVIDVATGTGIWAIDFADEFPEAEVIGTDVSPIQPTWIPPNLKFEIEDCTLDWTFPADSTDYIHLRWLIGSIVDWDALFANAYRTCRPGGWVESLEGSPYFLSEGGFYIEGSKTLGRTFTVVEDELQRKGMEKAGFVDIQVKDFKRPIGTWPKDPVLKEVGTMAQLALEVDAEGFLIYTANVIGWRPEEVQVYLAHMRHEIRSNQYLPYHVQRVVYGRKPE